MHSVECAITILGSNDEDFVPIPFIGSLRVREYNSDQQKISDVSFTDSYQDGDSIEYSPSYSNEDDTNNIPTSLTFYIETRNQNDNTIYLESTISLTNKCGTYPAINDGVNLGWMKFVSLSIFSFFVHYRHRHVIVF